jgi:Uma2 family endonuclease
VEGFPPEVEAMTVTHFDHVLPWTEEEYLALGETSDRVELFDGSLHTSPAPTTRHQRCSYLLNVLLDQVARAASEITSPSNAAYDRLLKMPHYAEAGIPWYLLVDPGLSQLLLFRLDGQRYVQHAEGKPGHPLVMTEPVAVEIDPAALGLA